MAIGELTVTIELDPRVERLLHQTVSAMDRADLGDELEHVSRLIQSGRLLNAAPIGSGVIRLSLSPFAELSLQSARDTATDERLDGATKQRRIAETFRLAGMTTGSCA